MPRYELSEGASHKFWQIDLHETSFTTTYGRIGTGATTLGTLAAATQQLAEGNAAAVLDLAVLAALVEE